MLQKMLFLRGSLLTILVGILICCQSKPSSHEEMIGLLQKLSVECASAENSFCPEAVLAYTNTQLSIVTGEQQRMMYNFTKADAYLKLGEEEKAIELREDIIHHIDTNLQKIEFKDENGQLCRTPLALLSQKP